ncbi:phospholipase A2 [Biscogniauxia marginata]|nr:phospholipase A2 [Biscogniauxia marginata]
MEPEDPIAELLKSYNELNPSSIDELDEEPSPLEFMRYVSRNTPFVIRAGAQDWTATQQWSASYLRSALAGHTVNVAVTPFGNADAPTPYDAQSGGEGESLLFAKPHEEDQGFEDFLNYVIQQEKDEKGAEGEVRYAQTQNDNLRHEYISLFSQVQRSIAFARIALQKDPDAINLWVGNSRSVTALHRDNYENIYVQIAGQKHFVLLPALFQPCVNERELTSASYIRRPHRGNNSGDKEESDDSTGQQPLDLHKDEDESTVPFATWDPDDPDKRPTAYSHLAAPVRVTLNPGDMLYLPAMWYHKVSQSCSEDGICVAVNYWYDMEFSGPLYSLCSFVRNVGLSQQKNPSQEDRAET